MYSLRSISLIAIACAALTSAVPVRRQLGDILGGGDGEVPSIDGIAPPLPFVGSLPVPRQLSPVTGVTSDLPVLGSLPVPGQLPPLPPIPVLGALPATGSGLPVPLPSSATGLPLGLPLPVPRAAVAQSFPDIISTATDNIKPIVVKLQADISVAVEEIDHTVLVGHLNEIVVVLQAAIAEVKLVVQGPGFLFYKGAILSVHEVALIVYGLLDLIVEILYAVVKIVGIVDVDVAPVIIAIGVHLLELLTISLTLVVGLKAALVIIVKPVAAKFAFLGYSSILTLLEISS